MNATVRRLLSPLARPVLDRHRRVVHDEVEASAAPARAELQRLSADLAGRIDALGAAGEARSAEVQARLAQALERLRELDDRVQALATGVLEQTIHARQYLAYVSLAHLAARLPASDRDLLRFEASISSQNGEDGVLLEVIRRIGPGASDFVEIGAQAHEANCLFLADALGWEGVFIEADEWQHHRLARRFHATPRVRVVRAMVTPDNVEALLAEAGVSRDVCVLSLDIDGNDYWVWEAVRELRPRIVILESNAALPHARRLVQPYDPESRWDGSDHFGASLGAMRAVSAEKGYRFVYSELASVNSFFVRADLAGDHFLPEDEVVLRSTNYFLSAWLHRESDADGYIDLDADARVPQLVPDSQDAR